MKTQIVKYQSNYYMVLASTPDELQVRKVYRHTPGQAIFIPRAEVQFISSHPEICKYCGRWCESGNHPACAFKATKKRTRSKAHLLP
jgi:hypothetical protein